HCFNNSDWTLIVLLTGVLLLTLSYFSLRQGDLPKRSRNAALALRAAAIILLGLSLLEPMWLSSRPKTGANIVAVLADNSQGLNLRLDQKDSRYGDILKERLQDASAQSFRTLSEEYQTRFYQFDSQLKRIPDFTKLDFSGTSSRLSHSLSQLKSRFSKQPFAAAIVATDGNATDIDLESFEAEGHPPVFFVPSGFEEAPEDVSLKNIRVTQTPFDDSPVSIKASIAASGDFSAKTSISVSRIAIDDEITVEEEAQSPAEQTVTLTPQTPNKTLSFDWKPYGSGLQFYELKAETEEAALDASSENNRRVVMIDRGQEAFRILYVSGRPNWEYKFLNRALFEDPQLQMVGLIRVAKREPKFEFKGRVGESSNPLFRGFGRDDETQQYDQPVLVRINARDEEELRSGFPKTEEELFEYDAIIIDDLEADFFSYSQLSLVRRFVSERGGGLLLLGGADTLEDGGYQKSPLSPVLPVYADGPSDFIHNDEFQWSLTREGWVEPWTRVHPNEIDERLRLQDMPQFKVANTLPQIKPGARTLATLENKSGQTFPGLVAQNFGSGRSACVPLGDLWRWGLGKKTEQEDLSKFWRQLSRWLVTDTPPRVQIIAESDKEDGSIQIEISARDETFQPIALGQASVSIKRITLEGEESQETTFSQIQLSADPISERMGIYRASFSSKAPGPYVAEAKVVDQDGKLVGTAQTGWIIDPNIDEFSSLQINRALIEEIAEKTGGAVLDWNQLDTLSDRISKLPIQETETVAKPIWHNGLYFLFALGCLLGEWAIRRKRGLA
ncbi:MAG: hypothetical protein AAGB46_17620, partial [Verrucomicrobiota bacterium]